MAKSPLSYDEYLQLDKLLNSQHCLSSDHGVAAHDEMFFIIVHQAYELWFKCLLHELNKVCTLFQASDTLPLAEIIWVLNRITSIQQLLNQQLTVIETMSPKDFLSFRHVLSQASGFQSVQFRLLEYRLGILNYDADEQHKILACLNDEGRALIKATSQQPSLFACINTWLQRFAQTQFQQDIFWRDFEKCWREDNSHTSLATLFAADTYTESFSSAHQHLSYPACQSVLFMMHYCDHPAVSLAYQLLRKVIQVDDLLAKWRHGHSLMVHRMIGGKTGTGGSSGYSYLKRTVDVQRIFVDIAHLTTYMVPADHLAPADIYLR